MDSNGGNKTSDQLRVAVPSLETSSPTTPCSIRLESFSSTPSPAGNWKNAENQEKAEVPPRCPDYNSEANPLKASLLFPPGSPAKETPNVSKEEEPPQEEEEEEEDEDGSKEKGVRYSVNGKRIGRPPGTYRCPPYIITKTKLFPDDKGPFSCKWDGCTQIFDFNRKYYEHVSKHLSELKHSDWRCKWIGCDHTKFSAQYELVVHLRSHTKEKPHECHVCSKKYSRLENLKTHRRTHTGEKPYVCRHDMCGKRFTNASDCSKHQTRVHSTDKPYLCVYPDCEKKYTDPSSLRKHIKNHHLDFEEKTAHLPKVVRSRKPQNSYPKRKAYSPEVRPTLQAEGSLQLPITPIPLVSVPLVFPNWPTLSNPLLSSFANFLPFQTSLNPLLGLNMAPQLDIASLINVINSIQSTNVVTNSPNNQ